MSLSISTNTAALNAGINLAYNNKKLHASMNRLSSGRKLSSPVTDPGSLGVAMKLQSSINRLAGARNNVQNALSFLQVQDGMLETAGKIIDRMSELKGLGSQDPMKSELDIASYNNEFKDLQLQLYNIATQKFNAVSLFANHTTKSGGTEVLFNGKDWNTDWDNTLSIHTSAEGASGSKVEINKSMLLSALTLKQDQSLAGSDIANNGDNAKWSVVSELDHGALNTSESSSTPQWITLANDDLNKTLSLEMISVGVLAKALENVAFLRAQNGGATSRLSFNADSLAVQATNLRAAHGRIVDVDIAEESTNLAKYSILTQASASMLSQANLSTDVALMLLR
jgi:flagellin